MDADSLTVEAEVLKKGQTGLLRVAATPQMIESTLAPLCSDEFFAF
jgi:hypothetical protein